MTTETILLDDAPEPAGTNVRAGVLRTYSRLLRMVLDEISDAVLVLDPDGEAIISNRAFDRLLGPRPGRRYGQRDLGELLALIGAEPDPAILTELMAAQDVPRMTLELRGGGILECEVKLLSLEGPGDHRLITFRGTETLGFELRELRHRAFHDRLTGLPNRELLLDRLHQAIARRAREGAAVGVVFVDLDGFKEINDELGHAAGDEVLMEVSARLASGMRQVDTVGRLGGDEFVIVCESLTDAASIQIICQRVQESLADPFVVDGRAFSVSASMGAVVTWDHDSSPAELVARADKQMYLAKRDGAGRVSIETGSSSSTDERAARLARTLSLILEEGQLELVYLPVMALGQNRVVAVEALLRCAHPDLAGFNPIQLIELADQGGFLNQLSTWILREGARVVASMRDGSGEDLSVLINLSAAQLADPALGEVISLAASAAGIERRLLGFDIAERAIADNQVTMERKLRTLSDLGCQLFADDVTGGAVAVESLSRLGFSGIKLDRALVEAASADGTLETGAALVDSAHEFDMAVVAEGVADEATLSTARRLGCDGAQGYALYGVPRRLQDIKRLID